MKLNFKTFGEGEPIIFLHGLFGMLDNWQTFAKRIADEGYMAYLVDQRDHGKSPFTQTFNYQVLAEDLHQFMEDNWLHHAHILGHSMGGKTAMQFAMEYEDMIDKLIIVDIAPKSYKGGHEAIFDALLSIDLQQAVSRNEVADYLRSQLNEAESTIQFLMKNLQRNKEQGGFKWKMNVELLQKYYQDILSNIVSTHPAEVETLFVRGSESSYILDEDWNTISATFNNARLDTIQDAGHWVHAQKPDELFESVLSFISE